MGILIVSSKMYNYTNESYKKDKHSQSSLHLKRQDNKLNDGGYFVKFTTRQQTFSCCNHMSVIILASETNKVFSKHKIHKIHKNVIKLKKNNKKHVMIFYRKITAVFNRPFYCFLLLKLDQNKSKQLTQ